MINGIIIICTAILTLIILLYWFIYYLQWAECYKSKSEIEKLSNTHVTNWRDYVIPSNTMLSSQNKIRYIIYYNAAKNNYNISDLDSFGYKCK